MQIDVSNNRERACQLLRNVQSAQSILKMQIDDSTNHIVNSKHDASAITEKASFMISSYVALLQIQEAILMGLSKMTPNGKVCLSPSLVGVLRDYGLALK